MSSAKTAPAVTVYTLPDCVQCDRTKRELAKRGVTFSTIDVATNDAALAFVKSLGYEAAPVVYTSDGHHWYGFRPDLITEHIAPPAPRTIHAVPAEGATK